MVCRIYGVATIYLKEKTPWTRTLRELNSAGRVVYKDEFSRRIVLEFSRSKVDVLRDILTRNASSSVFEIKVICRGYSKLPGGSQFKWRRIGRRAAYGIVLGNYVFAEVVGGSLVIKLGTASKTTNPPSILPASTFQFSVDEVEQALDTAEKIVQIVSG